MEPVQHHLHRLHHRLASGPVRRAGRVPVRRGRNGGCRDWSRWLGPPYQQPCAGGYFALTGTARPPWTSETPPFAYVQPELVPVVEDAHVFEPLRQDLT